MNDSDTPVNPLQARKGPVFVGILLTVLFAVATVVLALQSDLVPAIVCGVLAAVSIIGVIVVVRR